MSTSSDRSIIFSIVILTYNRIDALSELLRELNLIERKDYEVVVVDNASTDGTALFVRQKYPFYRLVSLSENIGAVGRNKGMMIARGKYIITLDDDILGLDSQSLDVIENLFQAEVGMGALCFMVTDYFSGKICNWCHPCTPEENALLFFETTEISEGAVAFSKKVFKKTGYYTEDFFISHEGADLAARIIDSGYNIFYSPEICTRHKHEKKSRPGWRRYYYDTRNDFWLAGRNYRLFYAIQHVFSRLPKTFVYALRDGYLAYWFKAIRDGIVGLPEILRQRKPISREAQRKICRINKGRPGLLYYFRKRFFANNIEI